MFAIPSKNQAPNPGFTLAETLLAIALIAIALMALIGQSTVLAKAAQKGDDTAIAAGVARSEIDALIQAATLDQPIGEKKKLYQQDSSIDVYKKSYTEVGGTKYSTEIFVTSVKDLTTGNPVGSAAIGTKPSKARLKSLEAKVSWWEDENASGSSGRPGYGKLELKAMRLLKVSID